MPRATGDIRGAALATLAMLLAGSTVAVAAELVDYPVFAAQALRYGLAALLLLPVAVRGGSLRGASRRDWLLLTGLAATGLVAFNVCVVLAARSGTDPTAVGVVVGGVPVVLALVDPLVRGRPPRRRLLVAAVVVTAGAVVVNGVRGSTTPAGLALSVGALVSEASFSLLAAPVIPRLGPVAVSFYACLVASVMLVAGAVVTGGTAAIPPPTAAQAGAIVFLGAVVTTISFVAWYASIERLGVARAGIFAALVPVGALLTALVLGASAPHAAKVFGTLVVCAGIVLALMPERGERRAASIR